MNYKYLGKILGKIMILEGLLMFAPLVISLIYQESFTHTLAFAVTLPNASSAGTCIRKGISLS